MVDQQQPEGSAIPDAAYRRLFDDCDVSPIGLGTVKIGRDTGVKYPVGFKIPGDREVSNLLALAEDLGINLIDTAPAYGSSETRLGQLLVNRDRWVICTKAGEHFDGSQSTFDFSAKGLQTSVEASLRRLGTDYLDVVLLHLPDADRQILATDAMACLNKLKDRGLIRATGASTKTLTAGLQAVQPSDVIMVAYHSEDTSQQAVLDAASAAGRGVLIKKGLESGHSHSPSSHLRFLMGTSMSSVIVGTINPKHLLENVAAVTAALQAVE